MPIHPAPIGSRVTRIAVIVCLVASLPGCSWLAVEAPPPAHARHAPVQCTSSRVAPVADSVFAVGLGAIGGTAMYDGLTNPSPFAGIAVLFGLAFLTPAAWFAGSAVSGFEDTSECDDAIDDEARRRAITTTTPTTTATSP